MANLCIKTPSSAILVLIFQLLVLRPRPTTHKKTGGSYNCRCQHQYLLTYSPADFNMVGGLEGMNWFHHSMAMDTR